MRKITIDELKPGMMFDKPLFIDEENIILQPELPLKQKEIDLLIRWNIDTVYTEGLEIKEKISILEHKDFSVTSKAGINDYFKNVQMLDVVFDNIRDNKKVETEVIDYLVNEIVTEVEENKNNLIQFLILGGENVNKLSTNAINSAILSTIIGKEMKMLSFRLNQLTTGALLHDIGMLKLPDELLVKKSKFDEDEYKQIKVHTIYGYNIILKKLKYQEEVANIALYHQERWDGNGYPKQLKGEEIPLGARVVAVTEAYEAMVNKRTYRNEIIGYKAMKTILSDNGSHFDPKVVRSFINSIGIYPIGSLVLLNNSSIGKVIEVDSKVPLRPKIELMINEYGDRVTKKTIIDLTEKKKLFIAKPIDPKEIEGKEHE